MGRHINGRPFQTRHINPPIAMRNNDWVAYFDGHDGGDPVGRGATEQEAIDDLAEQAGDEATELAQAIDAGTAINEAREI